MRIIQQKNQYAGVARNNGLKIAQGEYVIFLDSDDFFKEDLLEKTYNQGKKVDADIVLFGAKCFDNKNGNYIEMPHYFQRKYIPGEVFSRRELKEKIFIITTSCPWTKIFRREFVLDNNIWFQDLKTSNDVYFVLVALATANRITYVDDDLVACHHDLKQLMPYLHLPIQSGSDKILKAMNRRHNSSDYLRVVEKLQTANPDLRMSSDFIVGFPGEEDSDFQATLDIVNRVKFIQAFSFKYSRRAGTPAAVMPNQVEEKIKKERLDILQDLLFSYQRQFNEASIGKVMPVLFDMKGRHAGQLIGRTPYMQNLHAELGKEYLNKIVNMKITQATTNSLSGIKED